MVTYTFVAFLGLSVIIALIDWRRGWYLAILVGILQDPVRKITAGTPVIMIMSIIAVYLAVVVGAWPQLRAGAADIERRYPTILRWAGVLLVMLVVAAFNGIAHFGVSQWKAPALAFFLYLVPVPAVLLGYRFLRKEEDVYRFFSFFAIVTAIAMVGVPLEFLRVQSPLLGTVAMGKDWIRHLPGIQIRILSGIYRSPDIMAWHAATLTIVSLILMVRRGFPKGWLWMGFASWGLFCCMLSGRRKMLYMVVIFAAIFLFRTLKRLSAAQVLTFLMSGFLLWGVVQYLQRSENTVVYTEGALATRSEILGRLEGGMFETIRQNGILGLGLGSATQGAQRFLRAGQMSWQEGGFGKLVVELGIPGLVVALFFGLVLAHRLVSISRRRDTAGRFDVLETALLAFLAANLGSFLASHQPYTDGNLVLMNAFVLGCLLACPGMREQQAARVEAIRSEVESSNALGGLPASARGIGVTH